MGVAAARVSANSDFAASRAHFSRAGGASLVEACYWALCVAVTYADLRSVLRFTYLPAGPGEGALFVMTRLSFFVCVNLSSAYTLLQLKRVRFGLALARTARRIADVVRRACRWCIRWCASAFWRPVN